jgi:hypothetical protein
MLVLARISPLFLLAPLFSSKMIPAARAASSPSRSPIGIAPIARTRASARRRRSALGG